MIDTLLVEILTKLLLSSTAYTQAVKAVPAVPAVGVPAIVIVPVALGIKYARRERELEQLRSEAESADGARGPESVGPFPE